MTDDGLCHICRRVPARQSKRYSLTTCADCDETAAQARTGKGPSASTVITVLLLCGFSLGWASCWITIRRVGADWYVERVAEMQVQWEQLVKCSVSGGRSRFALGKKGEADLQVTGCDWAQSE